MNQDEYLDLMMDNYLPELKQKQPNTMMLKLFDEMSKRAKIIVDFFGNEFFEIEDMKKKLLIGMGRPAPAPLTIPKTDPLTKPDKTIRRGIEINPDKVKDLKFQFSNGKAKLTWSEEGNEQTCSF